MPCRYFALSFLSAVILATAADSACAQVVNSAWNTGSGFWNVAGNWTPSGVPDNSGGVTYNVQIGNLPAAVNATVRFTPKNGASDIVSTLSVSGGADFLTNGSLLNVVTQTTIAGAGATLRIEPNTVAGTAAFNTLDLALNTGGSLTMSGGIVNISGLLDNNANSSVTGFGVINLGDADASVDQAFDNSALLQVLGTNTTPGLLTLHTFGVDTIDLDGDSETGVVDVANVSADLELDTLTLVVDGPLADAFGGSSSSIQIGQRDTVTFNRNVQFAAGASIQMDGGANVATLNGAGAITSIAGTSISIAGAAVISNNMTFTGTANTITVGANAALTLNGTVAIPQASALVLGSSSQLIIGGATTITDAANDFKWDGTSASTTVKGSGILALNVDQIDNGNDIYNSTLNLNDDGDLTVNVTGTSWTMAGTLNKNNAGTSIIAGDALNVTGTVTVNAGTLTVPTTTLAAGSTATINGGELKGGTITVGNANGIQGAGLVSARVINNTRLRADTGTLIVQTPANDNDWDGAANNALLNAVNGSTLELRDNATFAFTGTVTATGNSRVFTNQFALDFNPGSTLNLTASKYQSTVSTNFGGAVNIAAGGDSTIEVQNNFFLTLESTSVTALNSNLRLVNNNINIEAGASFSGTGAIIVPDGSHAVIDANANVNVLFDNQGALRVANFEGVGRIDVRDYQQRAAQGPTDQGGELYIELTGTSLNQYDRIVVNGTALLGGYLNLDIDGGFVPALGNTFTILTASGGVIGTFDQRDISGMPAGLTFKINYLPNAVTVQVVNKPSFSADFDDDGDVDFTDLAIWDNAFDLNQLGDANGDNRTDIDDWTLWRDQFGSIPVAPSPSAVPEPATNSLLIALAIAGLSVRTLRRIHGAVKTAAKTAAKTVGLCFAVAISALPSDAAAAPIMSVTDNGLVGGNRQWLVRVGPDAALIAAGHKSVAVELGFEVTEGELLSAAVNTASWPFNLPTNNSPFGVGADGLNVNTTTDTVFAALGSGLFNSSSLVQVLTIVTEGSGPATLTWGGYTVPGLGVTGSRIAQGGTSFNAYQGSLSVGLIPGDIDLNGVVNRHDAALFSANFGKTVGAVWTTGDFNGDGAASLDDLALLQAHLSPPGPSPQAISAVPEPSSMALALTALLLVFRAKCRSPRRSVD